MFASATYPRQSNMRSSVGAYQQVGVETGISGASPHKLVAMLFDGYMAAIADAKGGIRAKDVERKTRAITRAVRIIDEGLRSALNVEAGGQLAADLRDLYAYVSLRLTQANLRSDEAMLDECQTLIEPLRSAWTAIAPQVTTAAR
jgi:flagellar protein FliS